MEGKINFIDEDASHFANAVRTPHPTTATMPPQPPTLPV